MNLAGNTASGAKSSRTLIPLLVILFLVSYGLLTTLVVEQGRTIDAQRSLIHLLFNDSFHLSALKKELRKNLVPSMAQETEASSNRQANAPSSQNSVDQLPLNQVPLIQAPSVQVPSAQAGPTQPKARVAPDRKAKKAGKSPFAKPPAELTDPSDMRRVSFSI